MWKFLLVAMWMLAQILIVLPCVLLKALKEQLAQGFHSTEASLDKIIKDLKKGGEG
ncbi:MAG: hypothetical protein ACK5U7_08180 [Bacteroidota bacterium]